MASDIPIVVQITFDGVLQEGITIDIDDPEIFVTKFWDAITGVVEESGGTYYVE